MLGENLGNYHVIGKIGEGGMGAVYLAEHTLIGRRAAIKVLLPELSQQTEMVKRFCNEARTSGLINPPGSADLFDFGPTPAGSLYIVMELLEGESLVDVLRAAGQLPASSAVALARQIAAALVAAHAKGVIHRDLKPDNVYLLPSSD